MCLDKSNGPIVQYSSCTQVCTRELWAQHTRRIIIQKSVKVIHFTHIITLEPWLNLDAASSVSASVTCSLAVFEQPETILLHLRQLIALHYRTSTVANTTLALKVSYSPYSVSDLKCSSSRRTSTMTGVTVGRSCCKGSGVFDAFRPNHEDFLGGGGGRAMYSCGSCTVSTGLPSDTAFRSCTCSSRRASSCDQNCVPFWRPSNCIMVGALPSGKPTTTPFRLAS